MEKHLTDFSRSVINDAKMGAYYTDLSHCDRISQMLSFGSEETVCLEPFIGDAQAILHVTRAAERPNLKIFGVELNPETCRKDLDPLREQGRITEYVHADFFSEVRITNRSFPFCFSNPPYQTDAMTGERMELKALGQISQYLKMDGVLVWVIPYSVFMMPEHMRHWVSRYDTFGVWKFDDSEFAKYKQIVAIGRRRQGVMASKQELEAMQEKYGELEKIQYLPEHYDGPKITVNSGSEAAIHSFATKEFDYGRAMEAVLKADPLKQANNDLFTVPEWTASGMGEPPMPLKKDSLYLCSVVGMGQGKAGDHLQRGVAKVVEEKTVEPDAKNPEKLIQTIKTSTKVTMTIVENDGTIRTLS